MTEVPPNLPAPGVPPERGGGATRGGRGVVAAIDIGGTTVKTALARRDGELSARVDLRVAGLGTPTRLVAAIVEAAAATVDRGRAAGLDVEAVGLAVPGLVDARAGIGLSSMLLGWRDVRFVDLVTTRTGLPVGFVHDVEAGALAEGRLGAAVGLRDWLFLALGTGLGSTFVLDGRSYRGSGGTGGELAHVVAVADGPLCRCGKSGCLEMLASASAITDRWAAVAAERALRREVRDDPDGGARAVADAARSGDAAAAEIWSEAVSALATVVAGYVESMNPAAIVLGGGLAESDDLLRTPFTTALARRVAFAATPPVHGAVFGARAGLVGAALAAFDASEDVPATRRAM